MSTIWEFDHIENKHFLYRGKDCMKMFCASLTNEELKNQNRMKMQEYVIFGENIS